MLCVPCARAFGAAKPKPATSFLLMATPWLGSVTPFTLKDPTQLRASPPPPSLSSGEYVHDYNEVKVLESVNSTARTQAQTDLALFYSDNFLALWERTLRPITAIQEGDNDGNPETPATRGQLRM